MRRYFLRAGAAHPEALGDWADAWTERIAVLYRAQKPEARKAGPRLFVTRRRGPPRHALHRNTISHWFPDYLPRNSMGWCWPTPRTRRWPEALGMNIRPAETTKSLLRKHGFEL